MNSGFLPARRRSRRWFEVFALSEPTLGALSLWPVWIDTPRQGIPPKQRKGSNTCVKQPKHRMAAVVGPRQRPTSLSCWCRLLLISDLTPDGVSRRHVAFSLTSAPNPDAPPTTQARIHGQQPPAASIAPDGADARGPTPSLSPKRLRRHRAARAGAHRPGATLAAAGGGRAGDVGVPDGGNVVGVGAAAGNSALVLAAVRRLPAGAAPATGPHPPAARVVGFLCQGETDGARGACEADRSTGLLFIYLLIAHYYHSDDDGTSRLPPQPSRRRRPCRTTRRSSSCWSSFGRRRGGPRTWSCA